VATHDDLEQVLAAPLGQLLHAHVVEDQQVGLEVLGHHLVVALEGLVVEHVAHGVEDGAVEHGPAGLDQAQPDRLRQMAFSHARRTAQEHVATLTHEAAGGQVEDRLLLDRAVEVPVEIFQSLLLAERRGLGAPGDQPIVPHGQLVLKDQFQELGVVEPVGLGLLEPDFQRGGQTAQTQTLQRVNQSGS